MKLIIDIPEKDYQKIHSGEKIIELSCNIAYEIANGTPLDDITDEIYREKEAIRFDMSEAKAKWTNSGIYDGLEWALEIIDKHIKAVEE